MQLFSKFISYLFHPIFILFYIFIILLNVNPYLFNSYEPKAIGLLIINVVVYTIFLPLVTIFIMRMTGLIKSFDMKNKMERIGPYIATGIFYLWLFINIKDNTQTPDVFTLILLGTIIGLFIGFAINTVSKISIHAISMGGFLAALFLIKLNYSYEYFHLNLPIVGSYLINTDLIIILGLIIAGMVGSARLILKAHQEQDVYGGYIVGIFSQIIAVFFIL